MKKKVILMLGCLVLAALGCGSRPTLVPDEDRQGRLQAIVHIETRDEVTTVMSGPDGRAYTVRSRDGNVLEQHISESELWTKFPAIYHLLKTSYASDD
jgi:hypothetical protein